MRDPDAGATTPARTGAAPGSTVARLRELGFSETEARTWLALQTCQPATAYTLAKVAGLAKANVYGVVEALVERGAMQPLSGKPVRYATTPPERFLERLSARFDDQCRAVLDDIAALDTPAANGFVELFDDAPSIDAAIEELIRATHDTLYLKTTDELAAPFVPALLDAADRGVLVHVVASGGDWGELGTREGVVLLPHEGTGSAPSRPHELMLTITSDSATGFVATRGHVQNAYLARNPTLVYVMQTMLLHELYLAEIRLAVGGERLAELGIDFASLRARYRPERHGRHLEDGASPS